MPSAVQTRLVTRPSTAEPSSTSLNTGSGRPAYSSAPVSIWATGGRSPLFSRPSARSEAGAMSLRPCWYWMPMVSQPNRSAMRIAAMYSRSWSSTWSSVSSVAPSLPSRNSMPLPVSHWYAARASPVGHQAHLGDERGLAQALLEEARRVEVLVIDDGVVHAHAAFVEDTHDGHPVGQLARQAAAGGGRVGVQTAHVQVTHMGRVVLDGARLDPRPDRLVRERVGQVVAPDGAVAAAHLGQRRVDVEHAHQPRPLAQPVGHGQDRASMSAQPGQHVMAVLPDRLGHDDGRVAVDAREHVHAHALAGDEAVAGARIHGVRALHGRPRVARTRR